MLAVVHVSVGELLLFVLLVAPVLLVLSIADYAGVSVSGVSRGVSCKATLTVPIKAIGVALNSVLTELRVSRLGASSSGRKVVLFVRRRPRCRDCRCTRNRFATKRGIRSCFCLGGASNVERMFRRVPSRVASLALPRKGCPFRFSALCRFKCGRRSVGSHVVHISSVVTHDTGVSVRVIISKLRVAPRAPLSVVVRVPGVASGTRGDIRFHVARRDRGFSGGVSRFAITFFSSLGSISVVCGFICRRGKRGVVGHSTVVSCAARFGVVSCSILFKCFCSMSPVAGSGVSFSVPASFFGVSRFGSGELLFRGPRVNFEVGDSVKVPIALHMSSIFDASTGKRGRCTRFRANGCCRRSITRTLRIKRMVIRSVMFSETGNGAGGLFRTVPRAFRCG